MRGIFFRHVLRDICISTAAVAAVLLVILLTYQLAFMLGRAADGQVPADIVLPLVGLSMRGNLTIILPFAVLLGATLGLGRLYHDSEIAAAQACGIGTRTLHAAAGVVTLLAALLAAWISFIDGPAASRRLVELRTESLRTAVTRGLAPGQFRALGHGTTIYFRSTDPDGTLRDVFIQRDLPDARGAAGAGAHDGVQIVLADRARYEVPPDSDYYSIQLFDGETWEGEPGSGAWRNARFATEVIRIPEPAVVLPGRPRVDALRLGELRAATDPYSYAELHWRIAWVLITLLLGVLAVPLARLRPRQGPHARVLWAVLLFGVYAGLLSAGRTLLERGVTPRFAGLWWVHAVALALGAGILLLPRLGDWRARRRAGAVAG